MDRSGFIDFDIVAPLVTTVRYLEVINPYQGSDELAVLQETPRNPLTYQFHIEPKRAVVKAGDKYTFKLIYTALVPSTTIFSYFNIDSRLGICLKFGMKATCKGPEVKVSQKTLVFEQCPTMAARVKTVELKNTSEIAAQYQFDFDQTQSYFKLDKVSGSICPRGHAYVKISFHPAEPGLYSSTLFCLILHQTPIIMHLIGKCSRCNAKCEVELIEYPIPELITGGFQCYMCDVANVLKTKPTLSLSKTCLEFEHVNLDNNACIPSSFSVTNHLPLDVVLRWNKDENCVFEVRPPKIGIKSDKAELFYAYFKPKREDLFYSTMLEAQVYWGKCITDDYEQCCNSTKKYKAEVPLQLSIKLVGDTFRQFTYGWVPQYRVVPTDVVLPACVPGESVWTTFMIYRYGTMPLMYKFIPPEQSLYIVKPMMGIIEDDFQIIVVGITPDKENKSNYSERWRIRFNSNCSNEEPVTFRTYVELPNLQIGKDNIVYIPPVFCRCEQSVRVTIKNVTEHMVRFRYLRSSCPCLRIEDTWNEISPNEILYRKWIYTPIKMGNYIEEVLYEMYVLEQGLFPIGQSTTTSVIVCGYCEEIDLVALPDSVKFGPSACGYPKVKSIFIYNFGFCKIHFTLRAIHSSWMKTSEPVKEVIFSPDSVTINPSERKTITVYLNPIKRGFHEFDVTYDIRLNNDSEMVVYETNIKLMSITYFGIIAVVKIEDLAILSNDQMLCKLWLWKLLNLERINYELATMKANTVTTIPCVLPEAIVGAEPLKIKFALRNTSEISCLWSLKRKKNCDCEPINKTRGFSFRYKDYRCPHVLMLQITAKTKKLKPQKIYTPTITLNYILEGYWKFIYLLHLPNNRIIEFQAEVTIHSPIAKTIAYVCSGFELEMKDIAIGDKDPAAQVLWLYNFTEDYITYDLDSTNLTALNNMNYGMTVIKCCNPFGCLAPRTTHAVIFHFQPLEIKDYKIFCPLRLGVELKMLGISATGIKYFHDHLPSKLLKMPDLPCFRSEESLIGISVNYIFTHSVHTHSKTERVFFVKNYSKYTLNLKWNRYCILNVLDAAVVPRTAILKPGMSHLFKLVIHTYNQPCILTFQISCTVQDIYHLRHVQHSSEMPVEGLDNDQDKEKDEDRFTVTGIFHTKLAVSCNIQSSVNVDYKMSLEDQLKKFPHREKTIKKRRVRILKQHKDTITHTLEKMMWDIVHGNRFRHSLKHLQQEESPFYFQIPQNGLEYSLFKVDSFVKPPKKMLAEILEKIIYESLQDILTLDYKKLLKKHDI